MDISSEGKSRISSNVQPVTSRKRSKTTSVKTSSSEPVDFSITILFSCGSAVFVLIIAYALFNLYLSYMFPKRVLTKRNQARYYMSKIGPPTTYFMSANNTTIQNTSIGLSKPGYNEVESRDFQKIRKLNEGGFGQIYLAESKNEILGPKGSKIIVKILSEKSYNDIPRKNKMNFDQELAIMELLKDEPNIAKVLGYCQDPCAIVMKFYDLGDLDNLIMTKKNLSLKERIFLIIDIAYAADCLHKKYVSHSDLKPGNVLIERMHNGTFKCCLTDFGLSQILSDKYLDAKEFEIYNRVGLSLLYASPEVIRSYRSNSRISTSVIFKSDIYSFSLIAYFIINRGKPWEK